MSAVSQDEFAVMLAQSRTAFRLEYQREPLLGEQAAVEHWQQGNRMVPWEWPEWRSWLDLAWRHTSAGAIISRVRLVDEPPTSYQRWALECTPWHERSGDRIRYLSRHEAGRLGIPVENWWLFDNATVVELTYGSSEVPIKTLVTKPAKIREYRGWSELALTHAATAETIAA
jgi:hypothetical protein